jgi:hypothetical protein
MRGSEGGVAVFGAGRGGAIVVFAAEEVETPAAATLVVTAATITGFDALDFELDGFLVVLCPNATPTLITAMNAKQDGWRTAGMRGLGELADGRSLAASGGRSQSQIW